MIATIFLLIWLIMFADKYSAFDFKCPDPSHRQIRAKYFCNDLVSSYSCLFNENTKTYTELCDQLPRFVRSGQEYVLTGQLSNRPCSNDRYQPVVFWSNISSQCILKKSTCTSIGQTVVQTNTRYDNRCRCDYTKGFAFGNLPNNGCDCLSSEEDCSCYHMSCPEDKTISPDYKCTPTEAVDKFKCSFITQQRKNNTEISKPSVVIIEGNMVLEDKHTSNYKCSIYITIGLTAILFLPVIYWKEDWMTYYCCCKDAVIRNDTRLFDLKIPCNWIKLKESLNSSRLTKDLVSAGLRTTDFMSELPLDQTKWNRYLLLIIATEYNIGDRADIMKRVLCNQSIQFKEILIKPIIKERIPKRDVIACLRRLEMNSAHLRLLEPDDILDAIEYFVESLIFEPTCLIVTDETAKQLSDRFLDKVKKSVEKGSFECLLKYLQSVKLLAKISTSLHQSLPAAISCSFVRGTINKENEEQLDGFLTFEVENRGINVTNIIPEFGCYCSKWFMQELGLYPEKCQSSCSSIRLLPLRKDVTKMITRSIRNGCFSELLERILCKEEVIKSLSGSKNVKVYIKYCTCSCVKSGKIAEEANADIFDTMFILNANKSFLKEEFQLTDKMQSFLQQHDVLKDLGSERTKHFELILNSLAQKPELIEEFFETLKDSKSIAVRLEESRALYTKQMDNSSFPKEWILKHVSAFLEDEMITVMVFKDSFIDMHIFNEEYFTNIEYKDQEEQLLQFIIDTIQFGRKAMLLFVDVLNMFGKFTKEMNYISVDNFHISTDSEAPLVKISRTNSVIFEGEFLLEFKQ